MQNVKVSIIIPIFNEQNYIDKCLSSLLNQTSVSFQEIIVVDDGSTDNSIKEVLEIKKYKNKNIRFYKQNHKGPGTARNLGASKALGKILIFVDADMTFDNNFVVELINPILSKRAIGSDSQAEHLGNQNNYWALCWNIGRFYKSKVINENYKFSMVPNLNNKGGIFRAILKKEFDHVGGFETSGDYTDDESLGIKLQKKAYITNNAIFFHYNPSNLKEVWARAFWIGSGKFFNKENKIKIVNFCKYFPFVSLVKGIIIGVKFKFLPFILFKLVYDTAVWFAVLKKL